MCLYDIQYIPDSQDILNIKYPEFFELWCENFFLNKVIKQSIAFTQNTVINSTFEVYRYFSLFFCSKIPKMHPIDITTKFFYVNIRDLIFSVEEENGAEEGNETFIRYY